MRNRRSTLSLVTVGLMLLAGALLAALTVVALVYVPGRMITRSAEIGSTLQVEVPADRDMAVYTTLATWRAAECTVLGEDGESYQLRPDMTQQNLPGRATWYAQGSFELDRAQPITVTCAGPEGRFAVGPTVAIWSVLLRVVVGAAGLLLGIGGLVLVIIGTRSRSRTSPGRPVRAG